MLKRYRIVTEVDSETHVVFEGTLEELLATHKTDLVEQGMALGNLSVSTYFEQETASGWRRCLDPRDSETT